MQDLIRRFHAVKHDADQLCDLFEETPLEKRILLNDLVLQEFGITMPQFYFNTTQCIVTLYFNFEISFPVKFDKDTLEIIKEDGQIIDGEIPFLNQVNNEPNELVQRFSLLETDLRQLQEITPQLNQRSDKNQNINVLASEVLLQEDLTNEEMSTDDEPTIQQTDVENTRSAGDYRRFIDSSITPTIPENIRQDSIEVPQVASNTYQNFTNLQDEMHTQLESCVNVSKRTIQKYVHSGKRVATEEASTSQNQFMMEYLSSKRRKTDDIIIVDVTYKSAQVFITNNKQAAHSIIADKVNAHVNIFGGIHFICCNINQTDAIQLTQWLYSLCMDGHLKV